jgi:hypothetical protein
MLKKLDRCFRCQDGADRKLKCLEISVAREGSGIEGDSAGKRVGCNCGKFFGSSKSFELDLQQSC